jgi:hypothetical protein
MNEMSRKKSQTPVRDRNKEPQERRAARQEEWVQEAVRHLFVEAMADKRR